jgi:hypothetical protein
MCFRNLLLGKHHGVDRVLGFFSSVGNLSPAMGARNHMVVVPARQPMQLGYSVPDSIPGIDPSTHSGT